MVTDCTRALSSSDPSLPPVTRQLDQLAATILEELRIYRVLPLNSSIHGCYLGRLGGVASLEKGAVRAPLGRVYTPRSSHRGATANPTWEGGVSLNRIGGQPHVAASRLIPLDTQLTYLPPASRAAR